MNIFIKNNKGSMLMITIVLTSLFMTMTMGAIGLALMQQKLNLAKVASSQAIHIAEAGVNYYRWVLYHDHEEYCNKEACLPGPDYGPYGPYPYNDSSGQGITGYYELYITPPSLNGSTIVNIKSVGWESSKPNIKRSIEVQCGIPSWSSYSTLANNFIRFGSGTEVWGLIHVNEGLRFDGLAHNLISSAALDFNDPDHSGANEFGVHTHLTPTDPIPDGNNPPLNLPDRSDVFMAGRSFPVSTVSFNLLDNYINTTYGKATTSGLLFDPRNNGTADIDSVPSWWGCTNSTCDEGFHITFKTDNTFDIRGVSSVKSGCAGRPSNSINSESAPTNYSIPANGVIFLKNHVWVDGTINNSRATVLAFTDPLVGGTSNIYITNDLIYTNYDGSDSIGLIAQNDLLVGLYSEDDLQIDAALVAKAGSVSRKYYGNCGSCPNSCKTIITINGSLATYERYGFAYVGGTGYVTRNLNYDNNLTFSPPPHYPTTGEYTFISWKED